MDCNYRDQYVREAAERERMDASEKLNRSVIEISPRTIFDGICRLQFFIKNECVASFCGLKGHYEKAEHDVLLRKKQFVKLAATIIRGNKTRFINYVNNDDFAMAIGPKTFQHVINLLGSLNADEDVIKGGEYFSIYFANLKLAQARKQETKVIFL